MEVLQYLCNYGDSSTAADDNQPSQTINYYEGKLFTLSYHLHFMTYFSKCIVVKVNVQQ